MARVKPDPKSDTTRELGFTSDPTWNQTCDGCNQEIPRGKDHLTGIDGDGGYSILCLACCLWISNNLNEL